MRRWWADARAAAGEVADRPALWLPGALAWTVSVGWIALLVGVARPPSEGDLTLVGARIFTSGAWPWNALLIAVGALAVVLAAFALAAAGEAVLLRGRLASPGDVARIWVLGVACAAPAAAGIVLFALGIFVVAPAEFNAPDEETGAVGRTALRLAPILAGIVVAAAAGGALHAASSRRVVAGRRLDDALRRGVRTVARAGGAALAQTVGMLVAKVAYLGVATVLLRVLWAPIGERLALGGIDPATALLLVGFVAIWLCLVLAGGALHAWSSVSWTRVLGLAAGTGGSPARMETSTGP